MKSAVSVLAILAVASPAFAQNTGLPPSAGEVNLSAGFVPDPHVVEIAAGGSTDVGASLNIDGCVGMIAEEPDYRLNYTAGSFPLFLAAVSEQDISLVVNLPNGEWACNDDANASFNPMLSFEQPQSGQYDIWLGTVNTTDFVASQLLITEINPAGSTDGGGTDPGGNGFDLSAEPNFGTINLAAGFDPDPTVVEVVSGGDQDLGTLGSGCIGSASAAPDVRLNYEGGGLPLTMMVVANGEDTSLAVNGPDGTWVCNDDTVELDPMVQFANPQSGQYDIYVGTVGSGNHAASLGITETLPVDGGGKGGKS
ncbi:MAG: hypothetical protein MUF14_02535 [Hyphomonadaceae bacterium]|jgi:hypothetical protein|nr:hypothetical protein [Hyphomonadaceae bacterium]